MKRGRDIIFLRGTESLVVNLLLLAVLVIFIVPILIIWGLRLIYKFVTGVQKNVSMSSSEVESNLRKVY